MGRVGVLRAWGEEGSAPIQRGGSASSSIPNEIQLGRPHGEVGGELFWGSIRFQRSFHRAVVLRSDRDFAVFLPAA